MANELEIPGGVKTTNNVEADAWAGPYASLAAARSAIPTAMRLYRTVKIIEGGDIVEYIWRSGTDDADLLLKNIAPDPATESDYGITTYGTQAEMEDAANQADLNEISTGISSHLRGLKWFINRILATARVITGIWTAPTAAQGNNTQQIATTAFVQNELSKVVNLGDISGSVTIDLSAGRIFLANVVGNITLLSFSNSSPGVYTFVFTMTANRTIVWAPSKFGFPYKYAPLLTDPVSAGQASATDIFTGLCYVAGTIHIANNPNSIINTP